MVKTQVKVECLPALQTPRITYPVNPSSQASKTKQSTNAGKFSLNKAGNPSKGSVNLPLKPGKPHGDILFTAASNVVLPPRSIQKIQVSYPALANLPGKQRHKFLMDATDSAGNLIDPHDPVEVAALPAVVQLPRGQQAVGNKVSVFMVNNTKQHQTVLAHRVVGKGVGGSMSRLRVAFHDPALWCNSMRT